MHDPIYLGTTSKKMNPRDPYIFYHDGYYYHLFAKYEKLWMKRSNKIENLYEEEPVLVWDESNPSCNKEVWAPELHIIDGVCYIYVALDDGDNFNHRMYCLCNNSNNPLDKYKNLGLVQGCEDYWGIDGSILNYNNERYFIWSGWDNKENVIQKIFIEKMETPWKCSGKKVELSKPELDWEKLGSEGKNDHPFINEGPIAIYGKSHIHICYSAFGSWSDDYCLGLLTFNKGDILDKSNWVKSKEPILKRNKDALGPGHASFIQNSPDGKLYFAYHLFNKDCKDGWMATHAVIDTFLMIDDYPILPKAVNLYKRIHQ